MRADFCFSQKTRTGRYIIHEVGTNDFDCYCTAKSAALICKIDLAHAADIDATLKVIVAKAGQALFLPIWALLLSHRLAFNQLAVRR